MKMYFGDPFRAFDQYDRDAADEQMRMERRLPHCQMCGELITDEYCYVLDPLGDKDDQFNSCVHASCIKASPLGRNDRMNELLRWLVEDTCYRETPLLEEDEE